MTSNGTPRCVTLSNHQRVPAGVEAVERRDGARRYLFLINHGDADAHVVASGHDLLTGTDHDGATVVPAGGVRVLRRDLTP